MRSDSWKGHTGKRNVINIGIGGSDLGPVMAYEVLKHFSACAMPFRFVSNVDGPISPKQFGTLTVWDLDAAETLFIISSKTFTTQRDVNVASFHGSMT